MKRCLVLVLLLCPMLLQAQVKKKFYPYHFILQAGTNISFPAYSNAQLLNHPGFQVSVERRLFLGRRLSFNPGLQVSFLNNVLRSTGTDTFRVSGILTNDSYTEDDHRSQWQSILLLHLQYVMNNRIAIFLGPEAGYQFGYRLRAHRDSYNIYKTPHEAITDSFYTAQFGYSYFNPLQLSLGAGLSYQVSNLLGVSAGIHLPVLVVFPSWNNYSGVPPSVWWVQAGVNLLFGRHKTMDDKVPQWRIKH